MSEIEVYLHVGLHKTGTTFLQRSIFKNLDDFDVLFAWSNMNQLVGKKKSVIISNESFSGICYQSNISESYYEQFCGNMAYLKSLYPNSKVIAGFREPSSLINSLYKQHLQEGGVLKFNEFFNLNNTGLLKLEDFYFSKYTNLLVNKFGEENSFIFNYEDLGKNKVDLLTKMMHFMNSSNFDVNNLPDTRFNKSLPYNLEGLLRFLNKVDFKISKVGFSLSKGLLKKVKLTPRDICQTILPKIINSKKNRELTEVKEYFILEWDKFLKSINKI